MGKCITRLTPVVLLLTCHVIIVTSQTCDSVTTNTCFQVCNTTSCTCDNRSSRDVFTSCDQRCGNEVHAPCKKLLCTSGSCVQRCHGCEMQCTKDVKFCSQLCLSGNCKFKCAAKNCQTQCQSGECTHLASGNTILLPKPYLALLAGMFGVCAVLSAITLVISCYGYCSVGRNTYRRIRSHSGRPVCIEHPPSPV